MIFSTMPHARDATVSLVQENTFQDLYAWLKAAAVRTTCDCIFTNDKGCAEKLGARMWSPAVYNGTRSKANTKEVTSLVYDLDGLTFSEASEIAKTCGAYNAILYTTHSNRDEDGKVSFRLILNVSRPVKPSEYTQLWDGVRDALRLTKADEACRKDYGRAYFVPTGVHTDPKVKYFEGKAIDVNKYVALGNMVSVKLEVPPPPSPVRLENGEMTVDLSRIKEQLKGVKSADAKRLLGLALKGLPLAEEGGRDNAIAVLAGALVRGVHVQTPPQAIYEIMRSSVEAMPGEPPPGGWEKVCIEKIVRFQDKAKGEWMLNVNLANTAHASDVADSIRSAPDFEDVIKKSEAGGDISKYSEEQLATWLSEQGCSDLIEFKKRWIIQYQKLFFVFKDGEYQPQRGYTADELKVAVFRDLSRAPVDLYKQTKTGDLVRLNISEIMGNHASVAQEMKYSFVETRSKYEAKSMSLTIATAPLRDLEGVRNDEIQGFLDALDPTGKFTDWLSAVPRVERPLCAFYIDGPPGIGKTLLSKGISKLWEVGSATKATSVIGNQFNGDLLRCPFIVADEAMPSAKQVTAEFRNLIGDTSHKIRKLYAEQIDVHGCVRFLITANNDKLLSTGEDLGGDDLLAMTERVHYHRADSSARAYIEKLGAFSYIQPNWIDNDAFPKHIVWLSENHRIKRPGRRYLVEGELSEFHETIALGSSITSSVAEWVCREIGGGGEVSKYVRVGDGKILVNTNALHKQEAWEKHCSTRAPSSERIASSLRKMSVGVVDVDVEGERLPFFSLSPNLILRTISRIQTANVDSMKEKINAKKII